MLAVVVTAYVKVAVVKFKECYSEGSADCGGAGGGGGVGCDSLCKGIGGVVVVIVKMVWY